MDSIIINIFYIKINSLENMGSLNIGQSVSCENSNSDKRNQGYGQNYGNRSNFLGTQSCIDDRDLFDANALKNTIPIEGFIKDGE